MVFYAVYKGHKTGIFTDWDECKKNVNKYKNSRYKKFKNKDDAEYFVKYGVERKSNTLLKYLIKDNEDFIPDIIVYTDGSCINNGKENALAGIGVFFEDDDPRNVSSKIKGKQTNNTAEIKAILKAIKILKKEIKKEKKVMIYSDSMYAIRCCTSYGLKNYKNGWNKEIPNKKLVKKAFEKCYQKNNIRFTHILAHTNKIDKHSIGNDKADKLANIILK
jgi:ribonuclease HI